MPAIPRDRTPDATLAFLRDPYRFISKRCERFQSDVFEVRLMLQPTICIRGAQAAEIFYDPARFQRKGAAPGRIQKTLFGEGGVQGLDGEQHRHRKAMLMSLMGRERINDLVNRTNSEWHNAARNWQDGDTVVLYPQAQEILTRAVCAWAGVPLHEEEVQSRTRSLCALFDQAGNIGPKHWASRQQRKKAEGWAGDIIENVRSGRLAPGADTAAFVIALHRDLDGKPLGRHIAAVELLNILRPTVANAVYIVLAAHAIHEHPAARERIVGGDNAYLHWFVQEVRRFYPFFPAVAAIVREGFDWSGYRFSKGRRVMLDLYGTNHHANSWDQPDEFRPERFQQWNESPYNLIPQGGGDHFLNHRCVGEWITIAIIKDAVEFLVRELQYQVPEQDLSVDFSRLPALPRSKFLMRSVQPASV